MKTRRGLSTVVGMVFSIIALTTTVAYVSYSMNSLNQYNQTVLTKNQQLGNTASEKFQTSSVTVSKSKLNITLTNTGPLPINFTKIWVQNTSATNWINSYTPPTPKGFVSSGATLTNLGQNIGVYINPANSYNVKLVTSRGNTQQFSLNSVGSAPLNLQLLTLPPAIPSGSTSELELLVTNNGTAGLASVVPQTPQLSASSTATSCVLGSVSPASNNYLSVGQTAVFTWPLTLTGNAGTTCIYTVQLQNSQQTTFPATLTSSAINLFSSTTYSQYSGLLTMNYSTFKWNEGNGWQSSWGDIAKSTGIEFSVNVTNNDYSTSSASVISLSNMQKTSGTGASSPYSITISNFNAGTGNNRILVVGVSANNWCVTGITFGGTSLTKVVSSFTNNDAELWYLTNPSGTANIVTTTSKTCHNFGTSNAVVVGAYAFSGVDQTTPMPTTAANHNTVASSPTITITTQYPSSWVVDLPSIFGAVTLGSPTCTQQWNVNIPNAITGASSSTNPATPSAVRCAWTGSGSDMWDDVAIELKASGSTSAAFTISQLSQLDFSGVGSASSKAFYIVNATSTPSNIVAYTCAAGDYCITIQPGQIATLYFSATGKQGTTAGSFSSSNQYAGSYLMFGKFGGQFYAQNIPYAAVNVP